MKLTLKSRLISKYSSCTFWSQPWFQKITEIFHILTCEKISHPLNVSPVSSKVSMRERVNIIIFNVLPVVVFWKGKFFLLSQWRFHAYHVYYFIFLWSRNVPWFVRLKKQYQFDWRLVNQLAKRCLFDWQLVNQVSDCVVKLFDSSKYW